MTSNICIQIFESYLHLTQAICPLKWHCLTPLEGMGGEETITITIYFIFYGIPLYNFQNHRVTLLDRLAYVLVM